MLNLHDRCQTVCPNNGKFSSTLFSSLKIIKTRLGLQCQTPALSKVYFTWVGTIIWVQKNLRLKKYLVPKNFSLKIFWPKKIFWSEKGNKVHSLIIWLVYLKKLGPKKIQVWKNFQFQKEFLFQIISCPPKNFRIWKRFWVKKILVRKIFGQKFFGQKSFWS